MKFSFIFLLSIVFISFTYGSSKSDCINSGGSWKWKNNSWNCLKDGKYNVKIKVKTQKVKPSNISKETCLKSGGKWNWISNSWVCSKNGQNKIMIKIKSSSSDCYSYKSKYNHYVTVFSNAKPINKKYSLIMVKSYLDSLILTCDDVIDVSFYKDQVSKVKNMWNKYIPISVKNNPDNKWMY